MLLVTYDGKVYLVRVTDFTLDRQSLAGDNMQKLFLVCDQIFEKEE